MAKKLASNVVADVMAKAPKTKTKKVKVEPPQPPAPILPEPLTPPPPTPTGPTSSPTPEYPTAESLGYVEAPIVSYAGRVGVTDNFPHGVTTTPTGFKAITRKGEFVTIVSNTYRLIPLEWTNQALQEALKNLQAKGHACKNANPPHVNLGKWCSTEYYHVQTADVIDGTPLTAGFVLTNSMNSRLPLGVRTVITIHDDKKTYSITAGHIYKHKHMPNAILDPAKLQAHMEKATQAGVEWAKHLRTLVDENPRDHAKVMMDIIRDIPAKYLPNYLDKDESNGVVKEENWPPNLWVVWCDVVKNVWLADIQEVSRGLLMDWVQAAFANVELAKALTA